MLNSLILLTVSTIMRQPLKLDYLWAGFFLVGAACFMFRGGVPHV
jgi:uncharacterized protein (DUF486 family)